MKKLLEIKEDELTEDKIKEVATRWETVNATKKGLKGDGEKPVRVRQVKSRPGQEKALCFRCQGTSHWSKECQVKPEDLKCSHCFSTGRHNTNDYCKTNMNRRKEEEKKKKGAKAKVNQISGIEQQE